MAGAQIGQQFELSDGTYTVWIKCFPFHRSQDGTMRRCRCPDGSRNDYLKVVVKYMFMDNFLLKSTDSEEKATENAINIQVDLAERDFDLASRLVAVFQSSEDYLQRSHHAI